MEMHTSDERSSLWRANNQDSSDAHHGYRHSAMGVTSNALTQFRKRKSLELFADRSALSLPPLHPKKFAVANLVLSHKRTALRVHVR